MITLNANNAALSACINEQRLWSRLMQMAEIGAIEDGGVCRQALTPEDIAARALLCEWGEQAGLEVTVDAMANLFLKLPGADLALASVASGSHMDSQPAGGRFDGIYGVLAGLEVLQAMRDAGLQSRRSLELVAWTNEEGGRFQPGTMGSMVFAGRAAPQDFYAVQDPAGISLHVALQATLDAMPDAALRPRHDYPAYYLEAHIEQGPLLENAGLPIGVVTGIQGARTFQVTFKGEAGHAGTLPLSMRKDALQAALRAITELNAWTADSTDVVRFTVGQFDLSPNSPNTVAESVRFSIDLRHPDAATLARLGDKIESLCTQAAAPCHSRVHELTHHAPCQFTPDIIELIENAANALEIPSMRLASGAFHDAYYLNTLMPTGMIFVPCKQGVSHHPAESAKPAELVAGAKVLGACMFQLANS